MTQTFVTICETCYLWIMGSFPRAEQLEPGRCCNCKDFGTVIAIAASITLPGCVIE